MMAGLIGMDSTDIASGKVFIRLDELMKGSQEGLLWAGKELLSHSGVRFLHI